MGMNELDYSCYLALIKRLEAAGPKPGSREALRLEVLRFRVRLYEADRFGRPPPGEEESAKFLQLLGKVLAPARVPEVDHAAMGKGPAVMVRAGR